MIEDEYKSACMKNVQHEEYQNKYNEVRLAEEEPCDVQLEYKL